MASARNLRLALFCAGSAALLAVGFGVTREGDPREAGPLLHKPSVGASVRRAPAGVAHEQELRRDAREFLGGFLRYEGGELSRSVRASLRWWASRKFASDLLAEPPRLQGGLPRARIDRLRVAEASWRPAIAVVDGVAKRAKASERFSFLFARSGRRWRAEGPAP
jgi:hypothetical protein